MADSDLQQSPTANTLSPPSSNIIYPPQESLQSFSTRSIRFGTFRTTPSKTSGFHIASTGLYFYIQTSESENSNSRTANGVGSGSENSSLSRRPIHEKESQQQQIVKRSPIESFNIHISWKHIDEVKYYLGTQLAVIFILVTPQATERLRATFRIDKDAAKFDNNVPYFDAESKHEFHKFITVVVNEPTTSDAREIEEFFRAFTRNRSEELRRIDFTNLNYRQANSQLTSTMPPSTCSTIFQNGASKQNYVAVTPSRARSLGMGRSLGVAATLTLIQQNNNTNVVTPAPLQFDQSHRFLTYLNGQATTLTPPTRSSIATLASQSSPIIFRQLHTTPIVQLPPILSPQSIGSSSCSRESNGKDPAVLFVSGSLTVHENDLWCLDEGEFLNDIIIGFYLDYLLHALSPEQRRRIHIFSSFFWTKFSPSPPIGSEGGGTPSEQQQRAKILMHSRVKTWTKNVDLFEKDFIIIPINEDAHWYLAIVCYPNLDVPVYEDGEGEKSVETPEEMSSGESDIFASGKQSVSSSDNQEEVEYSVYDEQYQPVECSESTLAKKPRLETWRRTLKEPRIVLLDSLREGLKPNYKTTRMIRDYLSVEWASRKSDQPLRQFSPAIMKAIYAKPPQQTNMSDCGVFLLEYAERFLFNGLLSEIEDGASAKPIGEDFWSIISSRSTKNMDAWFPVERVKAKRNELKDLLLKMADNWKEEQKRKANAVDVDSPCKSDEIILVVSPEVEKRNEGDLDSSSS